MSGQQRPSATARSEAVRNYIDHLKRQPTAHEYDGYPHCQSECHDQTCLLGGCAAVRCPACGPAQNDQEQGR